MAIQFDLDARDIGLAKELDKNEKKVVRLTAQVKKLKKGLKETGKEGSSAMGDFAKSMLPVVSVASAISVAFKAVKGEIDRVLEAGKKARDLKMGIGQSEATAWSNLQTQGIFANVNQFRKMGQDISLDTGLGIPEINAIMSTTASTAPNQMNQQQFAEKVTLAAKGQQMRFSSGSDIGRVINTIEKITGNRNANEGFTFARSFLSQSNMEDFKGASYALRGALAGESFGDTPVMSARWLATMSKLADDPKGRMSGTGFANMKKNLARKMFPLGDGKEGFLPGENTSERMSALSKVFPGLGVGDKAFAMSQIGGKATTQGSIEEALMNTVRFQRIHAGSVSNIFAPGSKESQEMTDQYWKDMGTGDTGFTTADISGQNAIDQMTMKKPSAYMSSIRALVDKQNRLSDSTSASKAYSIRGWGGSNALMELQGNTDYFKTQAEKMGAAENAENTPEYKKLIDSIDRLTEQYKEALKQQGFVPTLINAGEQD